MGRVMVEVVVPVHTARRPVARAVRSALDDDRVQVILVCHNIAPEAITSQLDAAELERCLVVPFADGIPSAAGPKNAGLDAASSEYVALLDSDDYHEPGAIGAWLAAAETHQCDVVFPPVRSEDGARVRTPRVRPLRRRNLHPVKDRLAYQTAHRGLIRRSVLERHGLRMTPGLAVGEDIAFTARLWHCAQRMDLVTRAPAYVQGTSGDQVTGLLRPLQEELAAVDRLVHETWVSGLAAPARRALAVKAIRVHILGAVRRRPPLSTWDVGDRAWLRDLVDRYRTLAPGTLRPLSKADRTLLDAIGSDAHPGPASQGSARFDWLLTPRPLDNLDRESAMRYRLADAAWVVR